MSVNYRPVYAGICLFLLFAACAQHQDTQTARTNPDTAAETDLMAYPCAGVAENIPCLRIEAGGKTLQFGAPSGIAQAFSGKDQRLLDGIFLFSLRAQDTIGVDDLRYSSLAAGRSTPLPVIGPAGTGEFIAALNRAYEDSDALYAVDYGVPPGGYDAAMLQARQPSEEGYFIPLLDTGDLQVRAALETSSSLIYLVSYWGGGPARSAQTLMIAACYDDGERAGALRAAPLYSIGCVPRAIRETSAHQFWPVSALRILPQ